MLSPAIALAHAAVLVAAVLTTLVIDPAEAAVPAVAAAAAPAVVAPIAAAPPPPAPAPPTPAATAAPRAVRPSVAPVRPRRRPAPAAPASAATVRPVSAPKAPATPARTRTVAAPRPPAPTAQQRLDSAVSRIQGYRTHPAAWELTDRFGSWGTADWYTDRVYISPRVPPRRLFDVVVHEWSHLRSVDAYDGDVPTAVAEMNRWFGGSGLQGAERAADCMARQLGATWTNYTACTSTHDREGAAALLAGVRLG